MGGAFSFTRVGGFRGLLQNQGVPINLEMFTQTRMVDFVIANDQRSDHDANDQKRWTRHIMDKENASVVAVKRLAQ